MENKLVKTCPHLESGFRMGPEGICACSCGALEAPFYWKHNEVDAAHITKPMIEAKRKELFNQLNDDVSDITCKKCPNVVLKPLEEVRFDKLGKVNVGHFTQCHLRCAYCAYTQHNLFVPPLYDAYAVLQCFKPEDALDRGQTWVDLNGGEPYMLKNFDEYLNLFRHLNCRVSLFTSAAKFVPRVVEGMLDGTITSIISSLDAGTPETFRVLKKRDFYARTVENLRKYQDAVEKGGRSSVKVKYVFHDLNCSDADIAGFVEAMKYVRPKEIWLNVDFYPLSNLYPGQAEVGVYDYSRHIEAYIKMYLALKESDLNPIHYILDRSAGAYLPQLRAIMDQVLLGVVEPWR